MTLSHSMTLRLPMTLRLRLILLLSGFCLFAGVAASVTLHSIRRNAEDAMSRLQESISETGTVDQLLVSAREHIVRLHDLVDGHVPSDEAFEAQSYDFFSDLDQVAKYLSDDPEAAMPGTVDEERAVWSQILEYRAALSVDTANLIDLVADGRDEDARRLLSSRVDPLLGEGLQSGLKRARAMLEEERFRRVSDLDRSGVEMMKLAAVVVSLAGLMVLVGVYFTRRWLIGPIAQLRNATERFSEGDLNYRVALPSHDELGQLGEALNAMAATLSKAQGAVTRSEAKYRGLFENLRDAVVICDARGRVVEFHDGETGILGALNGRSDGRLFWEVWPQFCPAALNWQDEIARIIKTGALFRASEIGLGMEDEEDTVYVDVIIYRVAYGENPFAAIVLRDVTGRRRMHGRLRRAETLEATGTLAGGLAHDFNNLLTSAIGSMSLLSEELRSVKQTELIQTATRACWQAANLARRLLDFATGGQGNPKVLKLNEGVEHVLQSLDESVFRGISVQTEYDGDVQVRVDRDQLIQIILNLVRNACDAMSEGGSLKIRTSTGESTHPDDREAPQAFGVLTVEDSGSGMSAKVKERVFQPFFTTKARAMSRGRGLGLSTVYASAKNAGGFIQLDSKEGVGTTFRVHLPVGVGSAEHFETRTYTPPTSHGEGTILIVDDEPMILKTCVEALGRWGYGVIAADSISDAARKFDAASEVIELAIVDINLPDGSGTILAEDLVTLNPELRIIFATGYAETEIPEEIAGNVVGKLSKPFGLDELADMLACALAPPVGQGDAAGEHEPG